MRLRLATAALAIVGVSATAGCEVILGYSDLKDRPADSGTEDSGSSSGSSSGGSSGGSSGSSSGGSSGGSSGSGSSSGSMSDAATCAPITNVPSSDVLPYTPVKQALGSCLQAQISGFITACASATASTQSCNTWQNAANNMVCQECILPSMDGMGVNYGGALFNAQNSFFTYNLPGCVALVDPTNGPNCAAELEPQIQCENAACSACQVGTARSCFDTVLATGGACAAYQTPDCTSDVLPDGGTFDNECSGPSGTAATQAVINVICGNGT
jgi:hypothetical protein